MLTEGFTKKFVMIGSGLKPNEFKGIKPTCMLSGYKIIIRTMGGKRNMYTYNN